MKENTPQSDSWIRLYELLEELSSPSVWQSVLRKLQAYDGQIESCCISLERAVRSRRPKANQEWLAEADSQRHRRLELFAQFREALRSVLEATALLRDLSPQNIGRFPMSEITAVRKLDPVVAAQAVLQVWGELLANEQRVVRNPLTDTRDAWLYEQFVLGQADKDIEVGMKAHPEWRAIGRQSFLRTVRTYARRNSLRNPPPRKSGRKRKFCK